MSIFNAQTDNVFVANLETGSDFEGVYVGLSGASSTENAVDLDGQGIALIRRLAPTQVQYDEAASLVAGAKCSQASAG